MNQEELEQAFTGAKGSLLIEAIDLLKRVKALAAWLLLLVAICSPALVKIAYSSAW